MFILIQHRSVDVLVLLDHGNHQVEHFVPELGGGGLRSKLCGVVFTRRLFFRTEFFL